MNRTLIGIKNAEVIIAIDGSIVILSMIAIKDFEIMVAFGIFGLAATFLHLIHNKYVQELRSWGKLSNHFWVIDWGPWGKDAVKRLDPMFEGEVMFVPGSEVRITAEYVKKMIEKTGNPMFHPLPHLEGKKKCEVFVMWYRRGEHIGESAKQYKKRMNAAILEAKIDLHTTIDKALPGSGFDKDSYEELYIKTHKNGSVL